MTSFDNSFTQSRPVQQGDFETSGDTTGEQARVNIDADDVIRVYVDSGGGGSSPRRTLAVGSSTASIANTEVDVTWSAPAITDGDITVSGAEITFVTGGTFSFDVQVMCQGNNRCEVRILTYVDTGSGFAVEADHTARNYTSRDSDQNVGNASLSTMLTLADGDKVKFAATCNADGTAVLLTAGTLLRINGGN